MEYFRYFCLKYIFTYCFSIGFPQAIPFLCVNKGNAAFLLAHIISLSQLVNKIITIVEIKEFCIKIKKRLYKLLVSIYIQFKLQTL